MRYSIKLSETKMFYQLFDRKTPIAQIADCTGETALKIVAALEETQESKQKKQQKQPT